MPRAAAGSRPQQAAGGRVQEGLPAGPQDGCWGRIMRRDEMEEEGGLRGRRGTGLSPHSPPASGSLGGSVPGVPGMRHSLVGESWGSEEEAGQRAES